jgi:predicted permease
MNLLQDLKFAVRLLIKDRWFTAVAVIALALGIGVNATVFTFVNAVLIRGLPFTDADRVLVVASRDAKGRDGSASYADFRDWRDATRTFASLSAFSGATMNLSDEGRAPERFQGPYISANAFKVIGQAPILGRDFQPDDDRPGAAAVVIFGNGVFKNRYGSDPSVIGRTVKVNEVPATVIGIMPEGFKYPNNADVWMPLNQMPRLTEQKRDARNIDVFGRLADRVTTAQAQSEIDTIARKLAADYPDTNKDIAAHVMTINDRVNGGPIKLIFLSLMGAVAFVLLIACANVANLLVVRASGRSRELAVRAAIGASRGQLVRQMLAESLVIAGLGTALGLLLARSGIQLLLAIGPKDLPRLDAVDDRLTTLESEFSFTLGAGSRRVQRIIFGGALGSGVLFFVIALLTAARWLARQRRTERLFRSLTEDAQDILNLIDRAGTLRYVSPAAERVLGWRPEELIDRSALELIHPDDTKGVVSTIGQALANPHQAVSAEFRFRHRDGSWRVFEATGRVLPTANSKTITSPRWRTVTALLAMT